MGGPASHAGQLYGNHNTLSKSVKRTHAEERPGELPSLAAIRRFLVTVSKIERAALRCLSVATADRSAGQELRQLLHGTNANGQVNEFAPHHNASPF